jgi:hypothetical protein
MGPREELRAVGKHEVKMEGKFTRRPSMAGDYGNGGTREGGDLK